MIRPPGSGVTNETLDELVDEVTADNLKLGVFVLLKIMGSLGIIGDPGSACPAVSAANNAR